MDTASAHEQGVVNAFIARDLRGRYLTGLSSKRRARLLDRFSSIRDFDRTVLVEIPPRDQHAAAIAALLRSHGAPDHCYLMSADPTLDKSVRELESALIGIVPATVISCIPGRLGYLETEARGYRFLLRR
jgi:hypothetical protein